MTFKDLDFDSQILRAIEEMGYYTPTPIQEKVLPIVLEGQDLQASAPTGTGKTAAYLLPSLQRMLKRSPLPGRGARLLILVPTRELACQVSKEAIKFSKYLSRMKVVCVYGGASMAFQQKELARPYEILVATPGRLMDHMQRGRIHFGRLEVLILDEADRMLDMGFIGAVEEICSKLPKEIQTLMFSATLKGEVLRLSKRLLKHPVSVSVEAPQDEQDNIEQRLQYVENRRDKQRFLDRFLKEELLNQAIIFTSTKAYADQLSERLVEMGHQAAALHGDMSQGARTKTLGRLREGKIRILVATDVAARGLDVSTISHVVNFDLPMNVEDYVHRIGRTGRAKSKGVALSFATFKDKRFVRQIEEYTGKKMISCKSN